MTDSLTTPEQREYAKAYYAKNREVQREMRNAKITCICGVMHSKSHTSRHKKTQGHLRFLKTGDCKKPAEIWSYIIEDDIMVRKIKSKK